VRFPVPAFLGRVVPNGISESLSCRVSNPDLTLTMIRKKLLGKGSFEGGGPGCAGFPSGA